MRHAISSVLSAGTADACDMLCIWRAAVPRLCRYPWDAGICTAVCRSCEVWFPVSGHHFYNIAMPPDRKTDLGRRLRESKFPRRAAARFTDEEDHNPMVLQDCAVCRGTGRVDRNGPSSEGGAVYAMEECPACGGKGITGEIERFFPADEPEFPAGVDSKGWVSCPKCGVRFSLRDPHRWTGRRHLSCGQKIKVSTEAP